MKKERESQALEHNFHFLRLWRSFLSYFHSAQRISFPSRMRQRESCAGGEDYVQKLEERESCTINFQFSNASMCPMTELSLLHLYSVRQVASQLCSQFSYIRVTSHFFYVRKRINDIWTKLSNLLLAADNSEKYWYFSIPKPSHFCTIQIRTEHYFGFDYFIRK